MSETAPRPRAYFAGMAVLLGLLAVGPETMHAPLLIGVALVVSLLLMSTTRLRLPVVPANLATRPRRARAPGVILPSSHPDAAGHPRPRAPGCPAVAPA